MPVRGKRIRINERSPWPERVGLEGCIVLPTAEEATRYPFHGRGKNEVIVLLDDDPHPRIEEIGFSCVLGWDAIDWLDGGQDADR